MREHGDWRAVSLSFLVRDRRFSLGGILLALLFSSSMALGQTQQVDSEKASAGAATIMIPDGTPVQLRFAQAVWGIAAGNRVRPVHAKQGDVVRLVVAADVSIGGRIVIQKGSAGRATVTNVWEPTRTKNGVQIICTCFSLHLDWIRSVNNQPISLRSKAKGKAGEFTLEVHSTHAGAIARPSSLRRDLVDALTGWYLIKMIHEKDWVPAGTRMTAFVHGNVSLDASDIDEALKRLPLPNETALVMVYRTKGQEDKQPHVYCDSKEVGRLGNRQYVVVEMDPGKHSCRPDQGETLEFSVAGGEEYYLYLKFGVLAGNWKLSLVNNLEGEDGVAAADPIPNPPNGNEPH